MPVYNLRFVTDVTITVASDDPNMSAHTIRLAGREDVQDILRSRARFEPVSWLPGSGAVAEFRLQLEPSLVKAVSAL